MGIVGGIAFAANLACFALLYRHRADNLNMTSTWVCSRNDLIANIGVLLAAAAGYGLNSRWPDIVVGVIIATVFLASALTIVRQALRALRAGSLARPAPPLTDGDRPSTVNVASGRSRATRTACVP